MSPLLPDPARGLDLHPASKAFELIAFSRSTKAGLVAGKVPKAPNSGFLGEVQAGLRESSRWPG